MQRYRLAEIFELRSSLEALFNSFPRHPTRPRKRYLRHGGGLDG